MLNASALYVTDASNIGVTFVLRENKFQPNTNTSRIQQPKTNVPEMQQSRKYNQLNKAQPSRSSALNDAERIKKVYEKIHAMNIEEHNGTYIMSPNYYQAMLQQYRQKSNNLTDSVIQDLQWKINLAIKWEKREQYLMKKLLK